MHFSFILLIIFFTYLRKTLFARDQYPALNKKFIAGIVLTVIFIFLYNAFPGAKNIFVWLTHALLVLLVYFTYTKKEFAVARPFSFALLPYLAIKVAGDFIKLIAPGFYNEWENVFDITDTFAIIWLLAMLYVNRNQRKELEQERRKAEEKEKEFILTQKLKAELEIQVAERTMDLNRQKEALEKTLTELKATQGQLVQSEKMASLGELTAGIAHEIQNPLNFVNNFSEVSNELIEEMIEEITKGNTSEVVSIATDLRQNLEKIQHHGKRADGIVKGMLQHSRSSTGIKEPVDINELADEYFRLAYHGLRAKNKSFNALMESDFDAAISEINIIPQDIGRVMLNLFTNAFYAVTEKKNMLTGQEQNAYEPTVKITTKDLGKEVAIIIKDNGTGISENVKAKIFQPFFTTKPTGQGTGLGLSMSYDIVTKGHNGKLLVESEENNGTEFIIKLPK